MHIIVIYRRRIPLDQLRLLLLLHPAYSLLIQLLVLLPDLLRAVLRLASASCSKLDVDLAGRTQPIVEVAVVEELQARLHMIISLELHKRAPARLGRVFFLRQVPDGFWVDSREVLLD